MFSLTGKIMLAACFCLCLSLNGLDTAAAQTQKGDYLWLDYGVQDDKGGPSQSEQLFVSYGQLPDKRRNISELERLDVFCTFGEKDGQGAPIYYKLNVEYRDGSPFVIIKPHEDTWCGVFAKAFRKEGKKTRLYTASTSFFAQGGSKENIDKQKYNDDVFSGNIDIELFRERIKEDAIYRRMGFPLGFTARFSGKPLSNRGVSMVDDAGKTLQLRTDWWGKFAYQPGGQRKFRENVIIIEYEDGDYLHKSTYTVFFRQPRNTHWIKRNFNYPFGLGIFFTSFITSLVLTLVTKKKFSYEN